MTGILIPRDRTIKQPARGFCRNPECLEDSSQFQFEFAVEHDHFACPKCGANQQPMAGRMTLIHFVVRNPKGRFTGFGGLKYSLACDLNRAYAATHTNDEAATGMIECANCPGCLAEYEKRKLAPTQGVMVTVN